jgi:6-phosphofructokinase 2
MTEPILTLTLNPTVDLACEAEDVRPVRKTRTFAERLDPGGGGLNVARVVRELGGEARAMLLSGGVTGLLLEELLAEAGVPTTPVRIAGRSRISHTVVDRKAGHEYRFVPEGPTVTTAEWQAALAAFDAVHAPWVVLSGSLPIGVPADAYARAGQAAAARGAEVVLDTSGEALGAGLGPHLRLAKPSLSEFEFLCGRKLPEPADVAREALARVRAGAAGLLAVTLGAQGAVLAAREGTIHLPGLDVPVQSAVGAGDSFLAAMVLRLAEGAAPADAFAWGVAAGTAAVSQLGTAHPRAADIAALRARIGAPPAFAEP